VVRASGSPPKIPILISDRKHHHVDVADHRGGDR